MSLEISELSLKLMFNDCIDLRIRQQKISHLTCIFLNFRYVMMLKEISRRKGRTPEKQTVQLVGGVHASRREEEEAVPLISTL